MQISFKLGLRAQEIALLQIKEIASLSTYTKNASRSLLGTHTKTFTQLLIVKLNEALNRSIMSEYLYPKST